MQQREVLGLVTAALGAQSDVMDDTALADLFAAQPTPAPVPLPDLGAQQRPVRFYVAGFRGRHLMPCFSQQKCSVRNGMLRRRNSARCSGFTRSKNPSP